MPKKFLLSLWVAALLFSGCGTDSSSEQNVPPVSPVSETSAPTSTVITVVLPQNQTAYERAMTEFAQVGGKKNPAATWAFESKTELVPFTTSTARAAAEYVAAVFNLPRAGQAPIIVYFKIVNGTAYVVKNIDIDGYAGVSVAQAKVNPVVEKTLLAQPGVSKVVFDVAPGDSRDDLIKRIQTDQ